MIRLLSRHPAHDEKILNLVKAQSRGLFTQSSVERSQGPRGPSSQKPSAAQESGSGGRLGFLEVPFEPETARSAQALASHLSSFSSTLVVVGIGGSSLGAQVFQQWFEGKFSKDRKILFLDNLDPLLFENIWGQVDPQKTSFLFVSKSGTSLETLATLDLILQKLPSIQPQQMGVITEPLVDRAGSVEAANPLKSWARARGVFTVDWNPRVGGRFSVLTVSGLVVASFLGAPVDKILQGARQCLDTQQTSVEDLCEAVLLSWKRNEWITQFWFYSSYMKNFGAWLEQLWSESLAKAETLSGKAGPPVSTPMICIGSSHQHSLLQQTMEGQKDKFAIFIRLRDMPRHGDPIRKSQFSDIEYWEGKNMGEILQAQALGTAEALRKQHLSVLELEVDNLGPECAGFVLMFWQMAVALLGRTLDIDPFNQPGVELGKQLAKGILKAK